MALSICFFIKVSLIQGEIHSIQLLTSESINVGALHGTAGTQRCNVSHVIIPAGVSLNDNTERRTAANPGKCSPQKQTVHFTTSLIRLTTQQLGVFELPFSMKWLAATVYANHTFIDSVLFLPSSKPSLVCSSPRQPRLIIIIYLQSAGSPHGKHACMRDSTCTWTNTEIHMCVYTHTKTQ